MVSEPTSRDNFREAEYVVLPTTTQRYPWEGFGEVGFRCAREVKIIEELTEERQMHKILLIVLVISLCAAANSLAI